jgi:hypothetical protein
MEFKLDDARKVAEARVFQAYGEGLLTAEMKNEIL